MHFCAQWHIHKHPVPLVLEPHIRLAYRTLSLHQRPRTHHHHTTSRQHHPADPEFQRPLLPDELNVEVLAIQGTFPFFLSTHTWPSKRSVRNSTGYIVLQDMSPPQSFQINIGAYSLSVYETGLLLWGRYRLGLVSDTYGHTEYCSTIASRIGQPTTALHRSTPAQGIHLTPHASETSNGAYGGVATLIDTIIHCESPRQLSAV